MCRALLLVAFILATPSSASIWPVAGWPDEGVPDKPVDLCQNVPRSASQCRAYGPCCVATDGDGPKHLLEKIREVWSVRGCSCRGCPAPVVYTNHRAPFGSESDGPHTLLIDHRLILYLDKGARISAPNPKNWPCDNNEPPPFINITASGCAICGPGDGMSADSGGTIDGGGRANGWYPDDPKGDCSTDFVYPPGSNCDHDHSPGAPRSLIVVENGSSPVQGFAMVGISLLDAPRYMFVPTGVNGLYLKKVWLTSNLPGALVSGKSGGDQKTCNLDGFHINQVNGAIIHSCTVQSGDDGIVLAYGNQFVSVSNCNLFNGHGTSVGQDGLEANKNYCNQHIAFQHITGVNQRWSLRIKAPMQEAYNTLGILYNDYCSVGAENAVSIVTAQNSQKCHGKTNLRIKITDFRVYTPGNDTYMCPDRVNPDGPLLGVNASTSIWKYSETRPFGIACQNNLTYQQEVDCGFSVRNFTCEGSCTRAPCTDSSSTHIKYLDDISRLYFSECPGLPAGEQLPPLTNNWCKGFDWSGRDPKCCTKDSGCSNFLTMSTSVFSKVQNALRKGATATGSAQALQP